MRGIVEILIDTLNSLIDQFVSFVPRLLSCLVILVVGYIIARIIQKIIKEILVRVGLEKVADKLKEVGFVNKVMSEIKLSHVVAKICYYFVMLVFATAATETLGIDAITNLVLGIIHFIPKIIVGGIILQIGIIVSDMIKNTVISICKTFGIQASRLIGNIVFVFFLIITFISAIAQIGINTALLESSFLMVVGGGVAAFAIGYAIASRDVLANMIASFYLKNKLKEGQKITIDGTTGDIVDIDSTSVKLKNDKEEVIIPLQQFQSKQYSIISKK